MRSNNIAARIARTIAAVVGVSTAVGATQPDGSRIDSRDPRPLADVVLRLESLLGVPITYEDPSWDFDGDRDDVTASVRRDSRRDQESRVVVPHGVPFSFDVPTHAIDSGDTERVLSALLAQYHASGNNGRFEFRKTGRVFHIVPVGSRDSNGVSKPYQSRLAVRATFAPGAFPTALAATHAVLDTIARQTGSAMSLGVAPEALLLRTRFSDGARSEMAVDFLARVLAASGKSLSWRLLCDPVTKACFLNIHEVPAS